MQHFAAKANGRPRQYKSCNITAEYNPILTEIKTEAILSSGKTLAK